MFHASVEQVSSLVCRVCYLSDNAVIVNLWHWHKRLKTCVITLKWSTTSDHITWSLSAPSFSFKLQHTAWEEPAQRHVQKQMNGVPSLAGWTGSRLGVRPYHPATVAWTRWSHVDEWEQIPSAKVQNLRRGGEALSFEELPHRNTAHSVLYCMWLYKC